MPDRPRIGSLFSGYGGLDLAAEAFFDGDVVWHVEFDKYPSKILEHHYPDIPNFNDVKNVDWEEVARTAPVDILTGGFPCQPASHAGKRKGTKDERWLWPYIVDAAMHLEPRIIFLENVSGLLSIKEELYEPGDTCPCGWVAGWGREHLVPPGDAGRPAGDGGGQHRDGEEIVDGPAEVAGDVRGTGPVGEGSDGPLGRVVPLDGAGEGSGGVPAGRGTVHRTESGTGAVGAADLGPAGPATPDPGRRSAVAGTGPVAGVGSSSPDQGVEPGRPGPDAADRDRWDGDPCCLACGRQMEVGPGVVAQRLAIGGILKDLAEMGFDVRWGSVRASDTGAPHRRERIFIVAVDPSRTGWGGTGAWNGERTAAAAAGEGLLPTPTANMTTGAGRAGRDGGANLQTAVDELAGDRLLPTPRARDMKDSALSVDNWNRADHDDSLPRAVRMHLLRGKGEQLLPTPAASPSGSTPEQHLARKPGRTRVTDLAIVAEHLLPTPAVNDMGRGKSVEEWDAWTQRMKAAHANGNGHGKSLDIEVRRLGGGTAPAGAAPPVDTGGGDEWSLFDLPPAPPAPVEKLLPTPETGESLTGHGRRGGKPGNGSQSGESLEAVSEVLTRGGGEPAMGMFGPYETAVRRWEAVLGRPAPAPSIPNPRTGRPRLNPEFVEWMMGLPLNWVTDPAIGLPANAQLKALGNGVVPAQALLALQMIMEPSGE